MYTVPLSDKNGKSDFTSNFFLKVLNQKKKTEKPNQKQSSRQLSVQKHPLYDFHPVEALCVRRISY